MKTKLQIIGIALTGLILTSCSSSIYMSKSSPASTDDIYYTPSKNANLTTSNNSEVATTFVDNSQNTSDSKFAQLEKEYADIDNPDTSSVKSDTLVTKAEYVNPYQKILSDSYEDSYERRLRGMEDPRYGIENFAIRYSDAYWYASAYDPSFYNMIIMGDQVWVEPWYISSMFSWPHNHFGFGLGFGLGFGGYYGSWNYWNNYYSPYSWNYNPYGYGGYYPYPNDYWNTNPSSPYGYYGRRSGNSTYITAPGRGTGISYENRITSSRRKDGTTIESGVNRTNNTRTRNSNQTDIISRSGQVSSNQVVIDRNNRNINTTRLRNEATTRSINTTEPTRRNNTYQAPRSTNNNDYIRTGTRNQTTNSATRDNTTRSNSTVRENRTTTPTYNRPSRVGSSTESGRSTSTNNSNRESSTTRTSVRESSSSSSSSQSASRSSSGSSSSSSSNTSTRRR